METCFRVVVMYLFERKSGHFLIILLFPGWTLQPGQAGRRPPPPRERRLRAICQGRPFARAKGNYLIIIIRLIFITVMKRKMLTFSSIPSSCLYT
jgi:hypothetical protein